MLAKIFSLIWALTVGGISFFIGLQGLEAAPLKGLGKPAADVRFAPEEILVKFKGIRTHPGLGPSADQEVMGSLPAEAQLALSGIGGHVKEVYPWIGVLRVQIPSRLPVGKYIEALYRSGTWTMRSPTMRSR